MICLNVKFSNRISFNTHHRFYYCSSLSTISSQWSMVIAVLQELLGRESYKKKMVSWASPWTISIKIFLKGSFHGFQHPRFSALIQCAKDGNQFQLLWVSSLPARKFLHGTRGFSWLILISINQLSLTLLKEVGRNLIIHLSSRETLTTIPCLLLLLVAWSVSAI